MQKIFLITAALFLLSACGPATQTTNAGNANTQTNEIPAGGVIDCFATGCGDPNRTLSNDPTTPSDKEILAQTLRTALEGQSGGLGLSAFLLPDSDNLAALPQDPLNPVTAEKVALGQLLFHDERFALDGLSDQDPSWACASCHKVGSGLKPGVPQGIGEGGIGIGPDRVLAFGFDPLAPETAPNRPDMQPIAVPSILNVAMQEVVLWNGQLGNATNGLINSTLAQDVVVPDSLPSSVNVHQMGGLESQAIAGQTVHRLRFTHDSPLQAIPEYQRLWNAAYPGGSSNIAVDAAKAIAAFERTIYANQAPFQNWLRGDDNALNESELAGANLFFGKAGCSGCHTGPALSSWPNAPENELFFAVGFEDFDNNKVAIHGVIADEARLGRGGFTKNPAQNYQFKVPQLYNVADTNILGHGASFSSIKEVVQYKNKAIPQNPDAQLFLDARFQPLNLTTREVNEITTFLTSALHDPNLSRYVPSSFPR